MAGRRHLIDPSISRRKGKFPSGVVTLVTEIPRIAARVAAAARSAGLPLRDDGDCLVVEVSDGSTDETCLTFGAFLSPVDQERVFLVREGVGGVRIRSLRQVLAGCHNSWFDDFLKRGLFTAHLQPIVDLRTGSAFGFEALLRASTQGGAPVPPDRAFGAARATGNIPELDAQARRAAFMAGRLHLGSADRLFVNLDPESLTDGIDSFELTLPLDCKLPMAPDRIVFELTEAHAVDAHGDLPATLGALRDAGFQVALDDLASGYSTLTMLERIRPDVAKLDPRLIRGAGSDRYRGDIVRAVSSLASELGVLLVAEGVETAEDLEFVWSAGIRLAQGFLFAGPSPLPVREFNVCREGRKAEDI